MTVEEKDKAEGRLMCQIDKTRKTVEAVIKLMVSRKRILQKVIGLDPKTLRKHYEYELHGGDKGKCSSCAKGCIRSV